MVWTNNEVEVGINDFGFSVETNFKSCLWFEDSVSQHKFDVFLY